MGERNSRGAPGSGQQLCTGPSASGSADEGLASQRPETPGRQGGAPREGLHERGVEGPHPSGVGFQPLSGSLAREFVRVKGDQNLKASFIHQNQELEATQRSVQKELLVCMTTYPLT